MRFRSETIWARYGVAILSFALAISLRWALRPVLGSDYPFATIFLAILFSSWYGGFGPTLLAALLTFATPYFLGPNNAARAGANPWLGALFYWGICLAIALLGGMFRVARRRVARQLEQIHNEREHLRATLSSIGDAVIVTDDHGRITLLNAVAESLTGWPVGEAQGQTLGEVFRIVNEHSRTIVESPVDRVLREGVVVDLANHTVLITKEGKSRPIDDSAAPIRDHAGRLIGVVLVFRDVTERRAADDVLNRLAAIVQSSDDAIVGKTVDGMITSWNAAAERIYGYEANEVIGRPFSILVPANRGREVEQNLTRLARGERIDHYETQRQRKDGTLIDVSMSHSPLRDREGALTAVAVIARDITAQREAQEKLLQNERELADFFENADRKKDDFLALLAHELRNPLAPIQSALQILKLSTVDPQTAGEAREVAERQLAHLTRLVDDLLDVSRIMRGKIVLRKERVDLSAIVNRAVETIRPAMDAERHALIVELPAEEVALDADIVRMSQALANLLSNAAKYTPAGGRIWLTAALDDGLLTVRVRDTGIGIAAETLPHLFDMFMQVAPGTARSQGGLGIGLTLVKSLIEMHGGTVAVQSEGLGRGSEFSLRLPAPTLKTQASAEPAHEKTEAPIAARRLLIVDDNVDAAQSLAVLLRLYGHQVWVAHGGEDALAAVAAEPPELILLDIGMPGMNGYEVASHLRKQFTPEQLTLVALTGWGQEQDRRRSKEAGFDHHLTKPVELATLRKVLAWRAESVPG